jgi:hypothetical protein
MKPYRSAIATMLCLLFGPIVWAAHLMTMYGAHALMCTRGAARSLDGGIDAPASVVAATTILALILMAGAVRTATRTTDAPGRPADEQSFFRLVMLWLTALSALAVLWAGATVAVIPACAPLR